LGQQVFQDFVDAGADGLLQRDLGSALLGRRARGEVGLAATPELAGLLEAVQALVDIQAGGLVELDVVAQEDDPLAGDAFLSGADGGVEDYGIVKIKGRLVVIHGSRGTTSVIHLPPSRLLLAAAEAPMPRLIDIAVPVAAREGEAEAG